MSRNPTKGAATIIAIGIKAINNPTQLYETSFNSHSNEMKGNATVKQMQFIN